MILICSNLTITGLENVYKMPKVIQLVMMKLGFNPGFPNHCAMSLPELNLLDSINLQVQIKMSINTFLYLLYIIYVYIHIYVYTLFSMEV